MFIKYSKKRKSKYENKTPIGAKNSTLWYLLGHWIITFYTETHQQHTIFALANRKMNWRKNIRLPELFGYIYKTFSSATMGHSLMNQLVDKMYLSISMSNIKSSTKKKRVLQSLKILPSRYSHNYSTVGKVDLSNCKYAYVSWK